MSPEPNNPPANAMNPPLPAPALRLLALACSLVLACSVVPVLYVAITAGAQVLWFSTLFEVIVLAAAVVGVLAGLGRFREGWALALLCVAGTVLVAAVFATVQIRANFRDDPAIGRLILPGAGFRMAIAATFAGVASFAVWSRNPGSWSYIIKAAMVLAPVAAVVVWLAMGNAGYLSTTMSTPGAETARIAVLIVGGLVGVILASAGGHMVIRAYELGRPEAKSRDAAPKA